jgi:hypothetical protein
MLLISFISETLLSITREMLEDNVEVKLCYMIDAPPSIGILLISGA